MNTSPIKMFPSDKSPRDCQKHALETFEKKYNEGYRTFVIKGPTGSGKSLVAYPILKSFDSGYLLTPSKILQNQYQKEFSDLPMLKGRSSFPCVIEGQYCQADKGPCMKTKTHPQCNFNNVAMGNIKGFPYDTHEACPYHVKVAECQSSPHIIANFHSIYFQFLTRQFSKRDLVILDECHVIEDVFQQFVGTTFTTDDYPEELLIRPFKPEEVTVDYLNDIKQYILIEIKKLEEKSELTDKELKQVDDYNSKILALDFMLADLKNVVIDIEKTQVKFDRKYTVKISPVMIGDFIKTFLDNVAETKIFTSATINLEEFCIASGFPIEEVCYIEMESDFKPELAPIISFNDRMELGFGYVNFTNLEDKIAIMTDIIEDVCKKFKNQRILIHTHSKRIEERLRNNINLDRPTVWGMEYQDKNDAIEEFLFHKNTIMFSYSMYQGVDFKDDQCRVVIFCKIPFLPYKNNYIEARKEIKFDGIPNQYSEWQTALKLIQGVSRHIRNRKDYGITIFLDNFNRFYGLHYELFPQEVKDRVSLPQNQILEIMKELSK